MNNRLPVPVFRVAAKVSARLAEVPHWLHRAVAFSTGIAILGAFPAVMLNLSTGHEADGATRAAEVVEATPTMHQAAESRPFEDYSVVVLADSEQALRLRDSFSAAESLLGTGAPERMPFEIVILTDDHAVETLRREIAESNAALAGAGREVVLVDARE